MFKLIVLLVVFCVAALAKPPSDCKARVKNCLPMSKCCKFPELVDFDLKPLIKEQEAKYKNDPPMAHCMIHQEVFKKIDLLSLDKADCKKYISKFAKGGWSSVMDGIVDTCLDAVAEVAPQYQKDMKIPKESCDAKYTFVADCLSVEQFKKCPEDSATKSEKCDNSKKFVEECMEDEAVVEFMKLESSASNGTNTSL